jgi:excisionase family DNA binding protein
MSEATWPTVTEASKRLGINGSYIRRLLSSGRIRGQQKGTTWIIDPESLRQYEATRRPIGKKKQPVGDSNPT